MSSTARQDNDYGHVRYKGTIIIFSPWGDGFVSRIKEYTDDYVIMFWGNDKLSVIFQAQDYVEEML